MSPMARMPRRAGWLALVLLGASLVLLVVGAAVGATGLADLRALGQDPTAWPIVRDIRLPRSLGAWLAGALLGLAGAVAQGLFRYRCFLPDLTEFAVPPCTGPNYQPSTPSCGRDAYWDPGDPGACSPASARSWRRGGDSNPRYPY